MSEERNEQAQYWDDVRGIAADVKGEIENGNLADWEAVTDYVHESVDGSARVIYTWKAKMAVIHSDNPDAYFDTFGEEGAVKDGTINWSALAYCAVEADVWEQLSAEGIDQDTFDELREAKERESEATKLVASMERSWLVDVLGSISIECQDDESDDTLREAIVENVKDGTLDIDDLHATAE